MKISKTALCALAGGLFMALSQWIIFAWAPEEKVMGPAQKIFYIHLPLAWWGMVSFAVACAASLRYLVQKKPSCDHFSAAAVEVGLVFCTLTLVTGSIWARHSWGVWWTWDPRLTTALILWFIYSGCLALRSMPMPKRRKAAICSVVTIAGFIDVPLVFLSARMWRSIHPAVFASKGGGLETEMAVAAACCTASFLCIWLALLILRWRQIAMAASLDAMAMARIYGEDDTPLLSSGNAPQR